MQKKMHTAEQTISRLQQGGSKFDKLTLDVPTLVSAIQGAALVHIGVRRARSILTLGRKTKENGLYLLVIDGKGNKVEFGDGSKSRQPTKRQKAKPQGPVELRADDAESSD